MINAGDRDDRRDARPALALAAREELLPLARDRVALHQLLPVLPTHGSTIRCNYNTIRGEL